ncbi:Hsp20/alpha crystallin family protein [Robertmurraya andreesenii]|uniref:HSP20 family protein n=1 Tax=Anoxybacillus andreesenii TaxID=1325932 RepID=A0ABT9V2N5_9BACL|nr:Hsp20/alpha crystallin family protein [Robertmurraya andreesenii]MDQ0155177.1 HSP20 family protein [Robertmurraya andreesenii]
MSSKLPENKGKNQEPFNEFRTMMNEFFHMRPVKGFLQSIDEFFQMPLPSFPVQLRETDDEQVIIAELPGIKREQISIDVLERSITISVKNTEEIIEENESENYYKKSKSMQQMTRNIYLGQPIDEKRVKATYQNGLLKIRVPKQKGKKIDIYEN